MLFGLGFQWLARRPERSTRPTRCQSAERRHQRLPGPLIPPRAAVAPGIPARSGGSGRRPQTAHDPQDLTTHALPATQRAPHPPPDRSARWHQGRQTPPGLTRPGLDASAGQSLPWRAALWVAEAPTIARRSYRPAGGSAAGTRRGSHPQTTPQPPADCAGRLSDRARSRYPGL